MEMTLARERLETLELWEFVLEAVATDRTESLSAFAFAFGSG
jgi:hypothetical protein